MSVLKCAMCWREIIADKSDVDVLDEQSCDFFRWPGHLGTPEIRYRPGDVLCFWCVDGWGRESDDPLIQGHG